MPADLPLAAAWTDADPEHSKTTLPQFWIEQDTRINSFVLEDEQGPVFFFRMVRHKHGVEIEIHIQFAPENIVSRQRTMDALTIGFEWLAKRLVSLGFKILYFHSRSQRLIYFCQKRLGFKWDGRRLEKDITNAEVDDGKTHGSSTQAHTH